MPEAYSDGGLGHMIGMDDYMFCCLSGATAEPRGAKLTHFSVDQLR